MGGGAVERIRTFDRLVNSQPLYRAEPRRHIQATPITESQKDYLSLAIQCRPLTFCLVLRLAYQAKNL